MSRRKALLGMGALGFGSAAVPAGSANPGNGNGGGSQESGDITETPIRDWSQMALDTVIEGGIAIPDSGRLYAIVHVAMHDAVNGIHQQRGDGFEARDQIIVGDEEPRVPDASRVAAVAKTAKVTLEETLLDYLDEDDDVVEILQDDSEDLFGEHVSNDTDGNTGAGVQWGKRVGEAVRDAREGSGFFEPDEEYPPDGEYDPEDLEPGQAQAVEAWGNANLGKLDPWTLDSPDQIRTEVIDDYEAEFAPPNLEDIEWAVDYEKTKLLGDVSEVNLDSDEELDEEEFTVTWSVDDDPVDEDDLQDAVD